jgi:hypothetical protein
MGQKNVAVLDLSFVPFRLVLGNTQADQAPVRPPAAPANAAMIGPAAMKTPSPGIANAPIPTIQPRHRPELLRFPRQSPHRPEPWCVARGQILAALLVGKENRYIVFSKVSLPLRGLLSTRQSRPVLPFSLPPIGIA